MLVLEDSKIKLIFVAHVKPMFHCVLEYYKNSSCCQVFRSIGLRCYQISMPQESNIGVGRFRGGMYLSNADPLYPPCPKIEWLIAECA